MCSIVEYISTKKVKMIIKGKKIGSGRRKLRPIKIDSNYQVELKLGVRDADCINYSQKGVVICLKG